MYTSKVALLGNVIDFAGTFPPASLPLEETLKAAAAFRAKGRQPWLMGKLALTVNDLKKLDARLLYEAGADGNAWVFTAIGSPAKEGEDEFERAVEWDLREIRRINERGLDASCRLVVVGYETKLPMALLKRSDPERIFETLAPVLDRFSDADRSQIDPYFEVSLEGNWRHNLQDTAEALARWCEDEDTLRIVPGIKVRTGGDKIPPAEAIAEAILISTTRGLRFKATQGLHFAVTRKGSFGFVNLFTAVALAQALGEEAFGAAEVCRCLEDESAANFDFGAQALTWSGKTVTVDAIEAGRRRHAAAFGSCSVDEPDTSLAETFPAKR